MANRLHELLGHPVRSVGCSLVRIGLFSPNGPITKTNGQWKFRVNQHTFSSYISFEEQMQYFRIKQIRGIMSENFCTNKFENYGLILGILRDIGSASTVVTALFWT